MSNITEETINQCSIRLGAFNSNSVDTLVRLLHDQDYCIQLTSAKNNLKEKFENLLTTKKDADPSYMFDDTPWTRIELAVVMAFKTKHLEENDDSNQTMGKLSIDDELNIAYAFLLAQINDCLSVSHVENLMFALALRGKAYNLFHVYENSSQNFSNFFASLLHCDYLTENVVIVGEIIRKVQSFIKRYEDFLITYAKFYKSTPEVKNYLASFEAMMKNNDNRQDFIPAPTLLPSVHEKPKPSSICISVIPQQQTPISSSSLFFPRKGLCVIINIQAFGTSDTSQRSYRAGSDKDVDVIKVIFHKLGFTISECNFDFRKTHLDQALDHIDDKNHFGQFDCLVITQIQNILRRTAEFVTKRDEYEIAINKREDKSIQKPEFLTSHFSTNFRFSNTCLRHTYATWSYNDKVTLENSLRIWKEYLERIYPFAIGNGQ
ncbi:hypothetical protein I4U23_006266 [Adineta vaga]|nr:hypothetical protein I4U23_006266 [Adineta vaga]